MNTTISFAANSFVPSAPSRRLVNKEVSVTGLYFRPSRRDERHIKGYPKRMEYEGREYTFVESGLRYLLQKGQQLFEVFDMTDGERDYRLKFDTNANVWTLVGVKESSHAVA
ncbi:MAG TPA: hypothetical protein VK978_00825 [Candidatus Saccharimonadales bacterium]|nr:hypothetical protein [Candidatus Saccharimonadales bacterium]